MEGVLASFFYLNHREFQMVKPVTYDRAEFYKPYELTARFVAKTKKIAANDGPPASEVLDAVRKEIEVYGEAFSQLSRRIHQWMVDELGKLEEVKK
jgi:hypothetical protein